MTVATHIHPRWLVTALAVAALASLGMAAEAVASGTASISGDTLVYAGDDSGEHVVIDKDPVRDDSGATVGAIYSVQDTRGGGVAKGTAPCGPHENFDAFCPFGSSTLQISLGGGRDYFQSEDRTIGKGPRPFSGCLAIQAVTPLRLDGGAGNDGIDGTRLADTIAGGPGFDAIAGFDGNDRVTGGSGLDLIETHDGNDVVDGGPGPDVIHLDAIRGQPQGQSCFARAGGSGKDIGRGGSGNDSITAEGGNDRLEGGAGNDYLGGGKGRDTLLGGPGRDRIYSRDGQRDYVNCGPGRDRLDASDRSDRVVGCEQRFLRPR